MKKLILLVCIFLAGITLVHATVSGNNISAIPEYSKTYDPERNPFQDGRDALELARKTNRFVMIEVGGDWCTWCHVLDKFIKDNEGVYDMLYGNYVVVKVNVSDENDNKEFLSGLPKFNGYPHLFITRDDGTVIFSTDVTGLVENGRFVHKRVMAFLEHLLDERPTVNASGKQ